MKQKLVSYFKEKWQDYASFILMIIIIFGMMYHLMELSNCELNIPLFYMGGDDMGVICLLYTSKDSQRSSSIKNKPDNLFYTCDICV